MFGPRGIRGKPLFLGDASNLHITERRIFQSVYGARHDVFPDGQRMVMAAVKPQSIHAPLTLVQNWMSALK